MGDDEGEGNSVRNIFSNGQRAFRAGIVLLVLAAMILPFAPTQAQGPGRYPDLVTPTPAGLRVSREMLNGSYHYLLRFDNTVVNQGGRLELTANLEASRDVYQNIYDQNIGGTRVERTRVSSDLIFHPQHNHFHFEGFASYEILKKNTTGHYLSTQYRGTKTSFCIIDYVRISSSARTTPQYDTCNASIQGMSAGWGDLYYSSLPDQWVDLGTSMPADGDYALQSIANPQRKIKESNLNNNVGVRYFTIQNGALVTSGQSPSCTATPTTVRVGDTVQISCSRITVGTTVDVRWGSTGGPILATVVSAADHKALANVTVPATSSGAYPIFAVVRSTENYYGAVVNVGPTFSINPQSGIPGASVSFLAQGYQGGETVSIRVNGSQVTTKTVGSNGVASGSFTIPAVSGGSHTVAAVGLTSGGNASATLTVPASIAVNPAFAHVQTAIAPVLSGFQGNETVNVSIQNGPALNSVQVNGSGSASGASTTVTLPAGVLPGSVTLRAVGQSSGAQATTQLLVLAAGANTPAATSTATNTPTTTTQADTRRVTTNLNMRPGPGTSPIIQVLRTGTIVTVTGTGQNAGGLIYVPIRLQDNTTGWVAEQYLASVTTPPTATATATRTATSPAPSSTATRTATTTGGNSTNTPTTTTQADTRQVIANLNMRPGPGTSPIIQVLRPGTIVTVTGTGQNAGGFFYVPIRLQDNTTGWVAEQYLASVTTPATATATSPGGPASTATQTTTTMETTVRLNMRSGPGTTFQSTEILPAGTQLTITGPTQVGGSYTWAPVRKSSGATGWVATLYLRAVAGPALPSATATSPVEVAAAETEISAPVAPIRLDDAVLRWLPEIQNAASGSGVPADIIAGVVLATSGGDPNVTGENGSAGLMLVAPGEFAALGISTGWHDPARNLQAGASTLASLRSSTGSIESALAAYFGDGCTSGGYCASQFVTDVTTAAIAYTAAINDPGNSGYAQLPSNWTPPAVAPFDIGGEVRPIAAAQVSEEIAPPTQTPVIPTSTATAEPEIVSPTQVVVEEPEEETDQGEATPGT